MPALTRRMKPRVAVKSMSVWKNDLPSGTEMSMSPISMLPSWNDRASRSGSSCWTTRISLTQAEAAGSLAKATV